MSVGQYEKQEDRPAYVRFERRAIEDKAASLAAGRSVSKDIDFALVTPPYSKDCVEYKVETWLRNMEKNVRDGRIPEEWAKEWKKGLDAWRNGQEAPLSGTDIRNWSAISPAQVKNLVAAGCRTIEDLASANDEGLKRIGMGGIELRNKAKAYLQAAKDHGPLVMKMAALETENAQLKGTIESLQGQIASIMERQATLQSVRNTVEIDDIIEEPSLEEMYFEKFGKKPHHMMKEETIRKALEI